MALDPVTAGINLFDDILNRFIPDPATRDKAKAQLESAQATREQAIISALQTSDSGQDAINVEEVKQGAKWRSALAWVCVTSCTWNWVLLPLVNAVAKFSGSPVVLAPANIQEMLPLLIGMLGLGAHHYLVNK